MYLIDADKMYKEILKSSIHLIVSSIDLQIFHKSFIGLQFNTNKYISSEVE